MTPTDYRLVKPMIQTVVDWPLCRTGVRARVAFRAESGLVSGESAVRLSLTSAVSITLARLAAMSSDEMTPTIDTWQDAEVLAAEHMRGIGFLDAHTTPPGVDGGIDVLAQRAVAQVKFHATPVGAPSVQQLAGIASARKVTGVFL